ncbi:MAG: glycosyltransferase family 2 protein [Armatimonadaceae bacterium]
MLLSVCLVNWNTREALRACLRALVACPVSGGEMEVVVVDNGSTDGSPEMMREEFPNVRLIANSENRIYAEGTNQAMAAATGEYLLLLNPDVEVLPGALDALIEAQRRIPGCGAVAARLTDPDGTTQRSVRGFPDPLPVLYDILLLSRLFPQSRTFAAYRMTYFDYDVEQLAPQPMTSCLLITRNAYNAVGGMDTRFPLYFNDVDWCLRAREAGVGIWYTPKAVVLHEGGGTTKKVRKAAVWESHRALLRLYEKHYKGKTAPWLYALLTLLVTLGAWARTGRWGEDLGRNGGETTPESLRRELEREGRPSRVPAQPPNRDERPGDHRNGGGG